METFILGLKIWGAIALALIIAFGVLAFKNRKTPLL